MQSTSSIRPSQAQLGARGAIRARTSATSAIQDPTSSASKFLTGRDRPVVPRGGTQGISPMRHSSPDTEILYRSEKRPAVQLPRELFPTELAAPQRHFLGLPDDLPDEFAELIEEYSARHDRGEAVSTLIMFYERDNGGETIVMWLPPGGQDYL